MLRHPLPHTEVTPPDSNGAQNCSTVDGLQPRRLRREARGGGPAPLGQRREAAADAGVTGPAAAAAAADEAAGAAEAAAVEAAVCAKGSAPGSSCHPVM